MLYLAWHHFYWHQLFSRWQCSFLFPVAFGITFISEVWSLLVFFFFSRPHITAASFTSLFGRYCPYNLRNWGEANLQHAAIHVFIFDLKGPKSQGLISVKGRVWAPSVVLSTCPYLLSPPRQFILFPSFTPVQGLKIPLKAISSWFFSSSFRFL